MSSHTQKPDEIPETPEEIVEAFDDDLLEEYADRDDRVGAAVRAVRRVGAQRRQSE